MLVPFYLRTDVWVLSTLVGPLPGIWLAAHKADLTSDYHFFRLYGSAGGSVYSLRSFSVSVLHDIIGRKNFQKIESHRDNEVESDSDAKHLGKFESNEFGNDFPMYCLKEVDNIDKSYPCTRPCYAVTLHADNFLFVFISVKKSYNLLRYIYEI